MGSSASPTECVIIVMDANRNKGNVDALNWALKKVVRPKDIVVVLGILCEFGKKSSCFPFNMGFGISSIWERLEFSLPGEMNPEMVQKEIEKKREEYQCIIQPFYRQCKKNEVKLEIKLAAGFDPGKKTIEEAQNYNTRWIVLDSYLKKHKQFIYRHVGCNVASMKRKDVATTMPSKVAMCVSFARKTTSNIDSIGASIAQPEIVQDRELNGLQEQEKPESVSPSPCWYPLSWRTGFPRSFTHNELESITNGLSDENIIWEEENFLVYEGILLETPVLLKCFSSNYEQVWSELKILSRLRHRNILNLIGYCCTEESVFLLYDYPCHGRLDMHLQSDELARNLPWKARWDIALGIGGCLRYLHEECLDGPIVHGSVCSSNIIFSHCWTPMLGFFATAKYLKDDISFDGASSMEGLSECPNLLQDERLSLDVQAYGSFLLELIAGQRAYSFHAHGEGQSFVDWAMPLLENGSLSQVMDPSLIDLCDNKEAHYMARAALLVLKNDIGNRLSMSEVLAVVRGDRSGTC